MSVRVVEELLEILSEASLVWALREGGCFAVGAGIEELAGGEVGKQSRDLTGRCVREIYLARVSIPRSTRARC